MPDLARAKESPLAPSSASSDPPVTVKPSPAAARYLEAIYYLAHEGEQVRPGRLAEWLGVSPPTVTVSLQRLVRDGLVTVDSGRTISFTEAGEVAAAAVVRRHRVVECWLSEELGFDWVTADAEAERVAYALSDVVLDRLYEKLGQPATCPHGNEIPGAASADRRLVSLALLEAGAAARVSRISELAEHDSPQVLGLLDDEGVVPGVRVVAEPRSGDPGVVLVRVGGRTVALSRTTAASVWVEPLGSPG